ncbi:MAG TPA: hydroxyacid dehydrogenase, partial [Candidatus Marinimicrobia bacterium]|nr:hydroxyacid dehydrogenase [Candidatus Neomarinimicrobiota bacterium]
MKVLVTDPISDEGKQILMDADIKVEDASEEKPSSKLDLSDIDGWIVRSGTTVTSENIEQAENLRVIGRAGVGVDNIDIHAATMNGVLVMNTPDANTISATEHTVALILALARNVHKGYHSMFHGKWEREKLIGTELRNKTIGVVGLGKIGTEVIKRLHPFKINVLGFDPYINKNNYELDYVEIVELDILCKKSDFITIHVPKTDSTVGLFDLDRLKMMKPTAQIVNCARGGIIDENALLVALNDGIISGAALDVFESEPVTDSPLVKANNILFTPHLGASTVEAKQGVSTAVCEQVRDYLVNETIGNALNIHISDMDLLKSLEPYLKLAEQLGILHQQIA